MTNISEFDNLFRQNYEPLFHFAQQFVSDEDDCHDIVSSAYESVWSNFASIESESAKNYLYVIVKNKAIDFLRKEEKHRSYLQYVELMGQHIANDDNAMEHEEKMKIVNQVLDDLGHPTSDILRACYVDEKKYKEVAAEMNISISTVKKHIVKALKHIREIKKNLNR